MIAFTAVAFAWPAWGQQIDNIGALSQEEFRELSSDLGSAFSFRPHGPAAPLGGGNWMLGVAVSSAKLKHADLLERATTKVDEYGSLKLPTLRADVGLPSGFDLALAYGQLESSPMQYLGGSLKWAFVPEGVWPAVGVRASASQVRHSQQLSLTTAGVDVSLSKRFGFATPYAGIGHVRVSSDARGTPGLHEEKHELGEAFIGVGMRLQRLDLNLEADKVGEVSAYSVKLSLHF